MLIAMMMMTEICNTVECERGAGVDAYLLVTDPAGTNSPALFS